MNLIDSFREFATENLKKVPHPSQNKEIVLENMTELVDLLFRFLNYEIDEPGVRRLKDNFELNFQKINDLAIKELPNAIENLATNFESFLRKLAYIKYHNTEYWAGDDNYDGIAQSTLADLIAGELPPKKGVPGDIVRKKYPEPLLDYSGTKRALLDFVRNNLRNAVHYAKQYNRIELIQYSNYVLGIYLMTVKDNLLFLRTMLLPEYGYLESILKNEELIKINKYYVELFGVQDLTILDTIAVEVLDGEKLMASLKHIMAEDGEEDKEQLDANHVAARVDLVSNIAKDLPQFILTGEPGSGKTTTLLKLQYEEANALIKGDPGARLPVFIAASSYSTGNSFKELVSHKVRFAGFEELADKFDLLLLLDGLNEIEDSLKLRAFNELRNLIEQYPSVSFILSARSYSFYNHWNLPVYELKGLTETQIKSLITKVSGENSQPSLWVQISDNTQIFQLCRNPLLLIMLIKVTSLNEGLIPSSKGMLYQLFNQAILTREKKLYLTDISTKIKLLSHLAFWMRDHGLFRRMKIELAKEIIGQRLAVLDRSIGLNEIFNELSDNNFFNRIDEDIEFVHETYQEYYVALEIKDHFFRAGNFSFNYSEDKWFEPLLICSDLFTDNKDREAFMDVLFVGERSDSKKKIDELSSGDLNDKFPVACKIAYHLKQDYPEIYRKAEWYMNNYLVIWSHQKSRGIEITTFEKLVQGISSLSSESLFKTIFTSFKYLCNWFYNARYDEDPAGAEFDHAFEKRFSQLSRCFVENLSDFELAYTMLSELIKTNKLHQVSPSIKGNIRRLKRYTIENTAAVKLIPAFKKWKKSDLLRQIGVSELDFYFENFPLISKRRDTLYKYMLRNHKNNSYGQQFLLEALTGSEINYKIKLSICWEFLYKPECLSNIMEQLGNFLEAEDFSDHVDAVRRGLTSIPLEMLREYGLAKIYRYPDVKEMDFQLDLTTPYNYHPDFLVENDAVIRYLTILYKDSELAQSFVKKLGLVGQVSGPDSKLRYCLVLNVREYDTHLEYVLYDISIYKAFKTISYSRNQNIVVNDMIILEHNRRFTKIPYDKLPQTLFSEGEIVSVNHAKREGFLAGRGGERDYYFSFNYLNFIPALGARVRFISGRNTNRKYADFPVAYLIREIAID